MFIDIVASSFTVGYAQSGLKSGATMVTAQFLNIGATESISITDIIPMGDDTYNNVEIQTLDFAGRTVDSYVWTDAGGEGWDQIGWVNDDNEIVTEVTFAPGQGLWVYGSSTEQAIRFPAPEL